MAQHQNNQAITGTPVDAVLQPFIPMFRTVGWEGAALLLLLGFFILSENQKKGKLANGRLVGRREITKAVKVAKQQMRDRERNKVTLYIGSPRWGNRTIWVPNAQEGIGICGAPVIAWLFWC